MCKLPRITSICHIGRPISQWQSIRCLIYICGMDDYGRKNGLYIGLFQRIHLRRAGSLLLYICFWLTSSCSGTPELVDIALRFFYSGVHPCLLLIGGKYSACLLTRFIFSAALYRDIHSYRSHFFVMKSFFGVHGNHCLLSGNQAWQVCSLNFPFISWIFSSPSKAPFFTGISHLALFDFCCLTPVFTWQKITDLQAMQCSTMSGCTNDMARGSAVDNFLKLAGSNLHHVRLGI